MVNVLSKVNNITNADRSLLIGLGRAAVKHPDGSAYILSAGELLALALSKSEQRTIRDEFLEGVRNTATNMVVVNRVMDELERAAMYYENKEQS